MDPPRVVVAVLADRGSAQVVAAVAARRDPLDDRSPEGERPPLLPERVRVPTLPAAFVVDAVAVDVHEPAHTLERGARVVPGDRSERLHVLARPAARAQRRSEAEVDRPAHLPL